MRNQAPAEPTTGTRGFAHSWQRSGLEFGAVALFLVGCYFGLRGLALLLATPLVHSLPPDVDRRIGQLSAQSVRAQHQLTAAPSPAQQQQAQRVYSELLAQLTSEEQRWLGAARVTVLTDPQVNAFALPGGETFVFTGLLDKVKLDDELRGVVAHELGHAVRRHGLRSTVRNGIFGLALVFILGDVDSLTSAIVAGASQLDTLNFSREMEEEADDFAYKLLRRSGHSPEGLAHFFDQLEDWNIPTLLATHPAPKQRAQRLRERYARERAPTHP